MDIKPADVFNPILNTASAVNEAANVVHTVTSPEFQQDVDTAKQGAVAYAGLTVLFQGITAACLLYLAYKAWSED